MVNDSANQHQTGAVTRVAILLRGELLRRECTMYAAWLAGVEATHSLVDELIKPLESVGAIVRVLLSFTQPVVEHSSYRDSACDLLTDSLTHDAARRTAEAIGRHRLLGTPACFTSLSQSDGLHKLMHLFRTERAKHANAFDLVLLCRHDLRWRLAIDRWPVWHTIQPLTLIENKSFAFLSRCEKTGEDREDKPRLDHYEGCVDDVFILLTLETYTVFDLATRASIATNDTNNELCFRRSGKPHVADDRSGHGCSARMTAMTGRFPALLTAWQSASGLREDASNPVATIIDRRKCDEGPARSA